MAASMIQRCASSARGLTTCVTHSFSARRWILSAACTDPAKWEQRREDPQNLALLASLMDKTYERKLPVSSLTIARFVDNISSREEVDQAEYYLYKFRHSPNCWYLRDWTIHSWVRQCLKYGARDKALHTLRNKVQYGIFPDDLTFNLLMDSFLKDEDYKGAFSVVVEVMLQEAFDRPSTQMLSLYTLAKYLETKPKLGWEEQRSAGAALVIAGMKQHNSAGLSAQLLGHALLGGVELSRGLRSVFHQMPLMWTPGYLGRALAVMERVASSPGDMKLSQEAIGHLDTVLQSLVSEAGSPPGTDVDADPTDLEEQQAERDKLPQYTQAFRELSAGLQASGQVDSASLQSLTAQLVEQRLAAEECRDVEEFEERLRGWEEEREQLCQREKVDRGRLESRARAKAPAGQ
ncbi:small ribosomal subunit protein mS27 [Amia ocellicauda]|uniref:small ribosomal subunit protein mS27 n=1 Tax=Amia ocellicauda TaxID=2972642 RepID=UPI003463EF5D|nr:RT27 protein [Amia calva]